MCHMVMNKMYELAEDVLAVMRTTYQLDSYKRDSVRVYGRSHKALGGKTPADACGIVVEGNDKWMTLIQNASIR